MSRLKRFRPSPAMAVALVALFVALGGVTWAATSLPRNSVGSAQLKKNAVSSSDIRNRAVTRGKIRNNAVNGSKIAPGAVQGSDINLGSLGKVPSAANADRASSAANADRASSAGSVDALKQVGSFKRVPATASNIDEATARAAAEEVPLLTHGPFTIYGKCFVDTDAGSASGPSTIGELHIKTSLNGAIFDSDNDLLDGDGVGFLDPGTLETDTELEEAQADTNAVDIDSDEDGTFGAIAPDGTTLRGSLGVAAKNGTLPFGNGLYGEGNVCLFHGNLIG